MIAKEGLKQNGGNRGGLRYSSWESGKELLLVIVHRLICRDTARVGHVDLQTRAKNA